MGKRELVALLNLSSWYLVMVEWLFLAVPQGCLRFVIVVFPYHTHLLFLTQIRFDVLLGLMWVGSTCKYYQQTTLVGKWLIEVVAVYKIFFCFNIPYCI